MSWRGYEGGGGGGGWEGWRSGEWVSGWVVRMEVG